MLFRFNRLTPLANIVSLQFTEISEYPPSSSYRASKSRFFQYIHCKFCRVCYTTKMTSATVRETFYWLDWPLNQRCKYLFHERSKRSGCLLLAYHVFRSEPILALSNTYSTNSTILILTASTLGTRFAKNSSFVQWTSLRRVIPNQK